MYNLMQFAELMEVKKRKIHILPLEDYFDIEIRFNFTLLYFIGFQELKLEIKLNSCAVQ